jgi:4-hydroxy-tetrahydrodipicolinate reductase
MKIALIGYGKMGKAIEEIALERGHSVDLKIDLDNQSDFTIENLQKIDVAIEFTSPHTAFENVKKCLTAGIATICGSTGWNENISTANRLALEHNAALIVASNFSLGVNLFFAMNEQLAKYMMPYPDYKASIEEIHHTAKKDAPSGTAITAAEILIANNKNYMAWEKDNATAPKHIAITSKRIDPAPGTHIVKYSSAIDDIELIHTAHSRTGFALGAVVAAEYLQPKKGVYTMKDVLGIGQTKDTL